MPLTVTVNPGGNPTPQSVPRADVVARAQRFNSPNAALAIGYTDPILTIDQRQLQYSLRPDGQGGQEFSFNTGTLTLTLRQEVLIAVKCNIHPWMRSYIGVVSHPFFAVTGDDGTFTIKGLPPGTYTIEIIHEKYGKQEQQVTVGAKETKTADFSVKG